jgi:hypothetical protein
MYRRTLLSVRVRSLPLPLLLTASLWGMGLPAAAQEANDPPPTFSMSPTMTMSGSGVQLKSTTPCPAPDDPKDDYIGVRAHLYRWNGRGFWTSSRPTNPDRSWAWTMVLPGGMRNGRYLVTVQCEEAKLPATNDDLYPYFEYAVGELDIRSAPGQPDPVVRLSGTDRIATAIAISNDVVDTGKAGAAVLASSTSFADSLAGASFAAMMRGPLLLTGPGLLDDRVAQELARIFDTSASGASVYMLGGTSALSVHVEEQLKDLGYRVTRIGGLNRYATAARIAAQLAPYVDRVFVADGLNFHDGLLAGAASRSTFPNSDGVAVVVLTAGAVMPAETRHFIQANAKIKRYAIGEAASKADSPATRVAGSTPVRTSVAVAQTFFPNVRVVGVANSASFADALAGGFHAASVGGPLLYTDPATLPAPVVDYVTPRRAGLVVGYVYGGPVSVSLAVMQDLTRRISDN